MAIGNSLQNSGKIETAYREVIKRRGRAKSTSLAFKKRGAQRAREYAEPHHLTKKRAGVCRKEISDGSQV
jgi:hypothetical protein